MTEQRARRLAFVFTVLVSLAAAPALAVSPAAEALFQEGRRLLAAGNTAEACSRFAESYAAEASSGTLLNLANCHEKLGKTATAWAEYRAAARLARTQAREDRAVVADEKAAALEATLARLTAVPANPVPGLVVATETGTFGEGGFGVPVPIDPGSHAVTVTAPGYQAWTTTVEVGEHEQRTLQIPELVPVVPVPKVVPHVVPQRASDAVVTVEEVPLAAGPATAPKPARLDLYLAVGGGAVALVGTAAWLFAHAEFEAAKSACNSGCTDVERGGKIATIERWQALAIGAWIAGGALLVTSGVRYGLRRSRARVTVAIDPVNHGLAALATF